MCLRVFIPSSALSTSAVAASSAISAFSSTARSSFNTMNNNNSSNSSIEILVPRLASSQRFQSVSNIHREEFDSPFTDRVREQRAACHSFKSRDIRGSDFELAHSLQKFGADAASIKFLESLLFELDSASAVKLAGRQTQSADSALALVSDSTSDMSAGPVPFYEFLRRFDLRHFVHSHSQYHQANDFRQLLWSRAQQADGSLQPRLFDRQEIAKMITTLEAERSRAAEAEGVVRINKDRELRESHNEEEEGKKKGNGCFVPIGGRRSKKDKKSDAAVETAPEPKSTKSYSSSSSSSSSCSYRNDTKNNNSTSSSSSNINNNKDNKNSQLVATTKPKPAKPMTWTRAAGLGVFMLGFSAWCTAVFALPFVGLFTFGTWIAANWVIYNRGQNPLDEEAWQDEEQPKKETQPEEVSLPKQSTFDFSLKTFVATLSEAMKVSAAVSVIAVVCFGTSLRVLLILAALLQRLNLPVVRAF